MGGPRILIGADAMRMESSEGRRIRAIMYGVGAMGKMLTRLLVERGVEIVGAVGHKSNIGADLGDIAGLGFPLNVVIENDPVGVIGSRAADIVVMSFCTELDEMFPAAKLSMEHGMNVISIAEEAFYPWPFFPQMTAELDGLAKDNGVTLSASGIQDLIWFSLVSTLTSVCHRLESVAGEAGGNIDEFGPVVAAGFCVGLSLIEFERQFGDGGARPTPFGVALEAVAADLGLTVVHRSRRMEPIVAPGDLDSTALGRVIAKGMVSGARQVDQLETAEGPRFSATFEMKHYDRGESDYCRWYVKGVPDISLENQTMPGQIGTCTMVVNRIPDVINAEPGFVTVDRLPRPKYRPFPLHIYVR